MSFLHFEVYTKVLWLYSIGVSCFMVFFYLYKYVQFVLYSRIFTMCNQIYKHICPICPWPVIFIKLGYLNVICMFILLSNLVPFFLWCFSFRPFFSFSTKYHYSITYFLFIYFIRRIYILTVSTGSFCVKEKNI